VRIIRLLIVACEAVAGLAASAVPASAGSAHFVGDPSYTVSPSGTITVAAKEAGLGNLPQIDVQLSGVAACVNPGGNGPEAQNKQAFSVSSEEPVQNGQSTYVISVTPVFRPSCSPPMTVAVSSLTLADLTNGIAATPVPASP